MIYLRKVELITLLSLSFVSTSGFGEVSWIGGETGSLGLLALVELITAGLDTVYSIYASLTVLLAMSSSFFEKSARSKSSCLTGYS